MNVLRLCHLCGKAYTDKEGHTKEDCINFIENKLTEIKESLLIWESNLKEAKWTGEGNG